MKNIEIAKRVASLSSVILFLGMKLVFAQPITAEKLMGTWEGKMSTSFQGHTFQTPISIKFGSDYKAVFRMSEAEDGNYEINKDIIFVLIKKTTMILSSIRLEENSLRAKIQLPSDPDGIASTVNLTKLHGVSTIKFPVRDDKCDPAKVPQDILKIVRKYSLNCPIVIPQNATWYEYQIIGKALSEMMKARMGRDYRVQYGKEGFSVLTGRDNKNLESFIKPLLQNPLLFRAIDCSTCMVMTPRVGDLKSDFTSNDKIKFNYLWSALLSAAETVDGVKIDLVTQSGENDERTVRAKLRRLAIDDDSFIYAEQITLKMEDPYKQFGEPGSAVQIAVLSRIIRRGISERLWIEVNLSSVADGGGLGVRTYDSESPVMTAILSVINR